MATKDNTPEEDIFEFLNRLDIQPESYESFQTFSSALDTIFEQSLGYPATDNQKERLFEMGDITNKEFPQVGIRKIQFKLYSSLQTRYVLPGLRGLFGFEKTLSYFRNQQ